MREKHDIASTDSANVEDAPRLGGIVPSIGRREHFYKISRQKKITRAACALRRRIVEAEIMLPTDKSLVDGQPARIGDDHSPFTRGFLPHLGILEGGGISDRL